MQIVYDELYAKMKELQSSKINMNQLATCETVSFFSGYYLFQFNNNHKMDRSNMAHL